jgi:hypothetical protein
LSVIPSARDVIRRLLLWYERYHPLCSTINRPSAVEDTVKRC